MQVFIKLIILWTVYFSIHSVFASHAVKNFVKRNTPALSRYYRIIYNVFAIVGLLAIIIFQSSLPQEYLYRLDTMLTFLGLSLATLGLIVVKESFSTYDLREFLGIRQMKGDLLEQDFQREGILNYVRHPLYSGSMLLLAGYLIVSPNLINLITVVCMFLYFIIGSYLEEKKLVSAFGNAYLAYRKEVPAFFPDLGIFLRGHKKSKK